MAFILVCSFFVRTDSTTVLGCTPPDPYQAPVEEALPLACQPHLLHPGARREHMFGTVHEHFSGTGAAAQVNSMALSSSAARQVKSNSEVGQQSAFSNQTNAGEKLQGIMPHQQNHNSHHVYSIFRCIIFSFFYLLYMYIYLVFKCDFV